MANNNLKGAFSLDPSGNIVTDPVEELIRKGTPEKQTGTIQGVSGDKYLGPTQTPSPTNVPGVTPKQAAAGVTPTPKISPTTTQSNKATIWDPNTGEKRVVDIGAEMPAGFKLWTGGTASGEEARKAIADKRLTGSGIPFGMSAEEARKLGYEPDSSDIASKMFSEVADTALEGEVMDEAPSITDTTETTDSKWTVPSFDEIMTGLGIQKLETKDYSGDYKALEEGYAADLEYIDLQYEKEYDALVEKNASISNALKAKLIKAGVDPNGTSFTSAVAGQDIRNEEQLTKLERARDQQKAALKRGFNTDYLQLSKNEREDYFNVQSQNINNTLQSYGTGLNIWQAFSNRDAQERQMEQDHNEYLATAKREWYSLDQEERQNTYNNIYDIAKDGYVDIYDENSADTLKWFADKFGEDEYRTLMNVASTGYWDRTTKIMMNEAQAESMIASTQKTMALLPYEIEKKKADISNIYDTISKRGKTEGDDDAKKELIGQILDSMNSPDSEGNTAFGADKNVSPDDYAEGKQIWIDRGFNPTEYDTLFKGVRNPNNPAYNVDKDSDGFWGV